MKINKETQLWEHLTPEEVIEMKRWAEDVVLHGKIQYPTPAWLELWYRTFDYGDRHQILLVRSAVPQKVLLSIVNKLLD